MITSVAFKNFRGLNDLTLPLSQATMFTGVNGVGKTSVLEGLYCLFSETRLDVSYLSRYNKTIGLIVNQSVGAPVGFAARQSYNYKLFWDECSSYDQTECSVKAKSDNGLSWAWKYRKARLHDLDKQLIVNGNIPIDSTSEFALWDWRVDGIKFDKKSHQRINYDESFSRAQMLTFDGGLYLFPPETKVMSICRYLDFAFTRLLPQRLPFERSKLLTKALQIIDPNVTDVRLTDPVNGLSVILNNDKSVTLGTIGNGAITWISALIAIFDVIETIRNNPPTDMPIIVLIDEMGAGIHYSVMLDVWRYINEFIKQNRNIQFVFTSHSDDCIKAYCQAFSDKDTAEIVRLHKTAVGGEIQHTEYSKDSFENIINGDWEVRG